MGSKRDETRILIDDEITCFNPTYVRDPNYSSRRLAAFILPFVVPLIYRTGETAVPSFIFVIFISFE